MFVHTEIYQPDIYQPLLQPRPYTAVGQVTAPPVVTRCGQLTWLERGPGCSRCEGGQAAKLSLVQ